MCGVCLRLIEPKLFTSIQQNVFLNDLSLVMLFEKNGYLFNI